MTRCRHDPPCYSYGECCEKSGKPLEDDWALVLDDPICDCLQPAWACDCELELLDTAPHLR